MIRWLPPGVTVLSPPTCDNVKATVPPSSNVCVLNAELREKRPPKTPCSDRAVLTAETFAGHRLRMRMPINAADSRIRRQTSGFKLTGRYVATIADAQNKDSVFEIEIQRLFHMGY